MTALLTAAIVSSTSLILAALGAVVAERAGVLTISLEGYMLAGAFGAVAGADAGGPWVGFFVGLGAGMAVALAHAFLSISMRLNQIVSGLALNVLVLGLTGVLNQSIFGVERAGERVPGFSPWAVPGLSEIPVVGDALFNQPVFTYVAMLMVVVVSVTLARTKQGLSIRAVGEFPGAAEAHGVGVVRTRYAAVLFSGAMGGLGGAMLSIGTTGAFVNNITAGTGYIALAAVIFAGWRPLGATLACLLFGFAQASGVWANVLGVAVAQEFLAMVPYVVAIIALAVLAGRSAMPSALGAPYVKEQR
jgi:simple sugar transport system permease protein